MLNIVVEDNAKLLGVERFPPLDIDYRYLHNFKAHLRAPHTTVLPQPIKSRHRRSAVIVPAVRALRLASREHGLRSYRASCVSTRAWLPGLA